MSEIPVKTSMLANGASTVTVRKKVKDSRDSEVSGDSKVRYVREDHIANVVSGVSKTEREDIKQHVRMLMARRGISLNANIASIARMLKEKHSSPSFKDKLALLSYANAMLGLTTETEKTVEPTVTNNTNMLVVNSMDDKKLVEMLEDIAIKTNAYKARLLALQEAKEI